MQKRLLALLCMLVLSTLLVTCAGLYLKFEVLQPAGLFHDKSLIEIPFAAIKDPAARFVLENLKEQKQREQETEPPTEPAAVRRRPLKDAPPLPTMEPDPPPPLIIVTERWFDDALFIGDSRTVGLRDYARLGNADYFCSVGMTVFDATKQKLSDLNFSDMNLETLLKSKRYSKIYISLGLNGCYLPHDLLMEGYASLLDMVQEHQPHAAIILQGMITLGRKKAASEWFFSLKNLQEINAQISAFADGNMIRYIDANEHFADEEGYLPSWRSSDGCHFSVSGYQEWAQWILDNADTLNISFG